MDLLVQLLGQYGLLIVFIAVLLEQGGLPLPAYPVVIVASALAVESAEPVWPIVLVTALAALIADVGWFGGGRYFGSRMIRLMCSLSLSRDSCVSSARETYARWGLPSLLIAKFVPGLAAVATTMAGQMRIAPRRFLAYDAAGALLWAGVAVALGVVFHHAVNDLLVHLQAWGSYGLTAVLALLVLFVGYKAWQRQRFLRQIRMARITIGQLQAMLESGFAPTVVDARDAGQRAATGWIPGAVAAGRLEDAALSPDHEIVVYCDCPNEASAAVLARRLVGDGYRRVRPLTGGFEAWRQAGLPVQRPDAAVPEDRSGLPPWPHAGRSGSDRLVKECKHA